MNKAAEYFRKNDPNNPLNMSAKDMTKGIYANLGLDPNRIDNPKLGLRSYD